MFIVRFLVGSEKGGYVFLRDEEHSTKRLAVAAIDGYTVRRPNGEVRFGAKHGQRLMENGRRVRIAFVEM